MSIFQRSNNRSQSFCYYPTPTHSARGPITNRIRANVYINGLVQDCSISIANALEILQSCTKLSIYNITEPCFVNFSISGQNPTELFSGIEIIYMKYIYYIGFNLASQVTHISSISTLLMVSNQNNNKVYECNDIDHMKEEHITVRYHWNTVDFLQNPEINTPYLEFEVWFMFRCCHCSAVCNIMIYWTPL